MLPAFLKTLFLVFPFILFCFPLNANQLLSDQFTVVWTGSNNVVLEIDGERYPMRAGQERELTLPLSDAIIVSVITPSNTLVADEFLILEEESEKRVYIGLANNRVTIQLGGSEQQTVQQAVIEEDREPRAAAEREQPARQTAHVPASGYQFDQYSFGLNLEDLDDGGTLFLEFYNRKLFPRQGENHGFVFSSRLAYFFVGGMYSTSQPMAEVPTFHILNFDVGAGYGWNLGKFTPSATFNLVATSFVFVRYELDENQSRNDSDSEFFPSPSDTAFIRLHAAFQPSEERRFYLAGSLDLVGIFGDNSDTTFYAGIGFSL